MTRLASSLLILMLVFPFRAPAQDQPDIPEEHLSPNGKIAIGLLLPDRSHWKVAEAATLAIEEANSKGGYKQHKFELVIRTAEGLWGAGSKESVSLVYEDHVRAIIGSLDGRNGHLAEQVIHVVISLGRRRQNHHPRRRRASGGGGGERRGLLQRAPRRRQRGLRHGCKGDFQRPLGAAAASPHDRVGGQRGDLRNPHVDATPLGPGRPDRSISDPRPPGAGPSWDGDPVPTANPAPRASP